MAPEALGVRAKDLIPNFSTQELAWSSLLGWSWEGVKSIHRSTIYHETVGCMKILFFYSKDF